MADESTDAADQAEAALEAAVREAVARLPLRPDVTTDEIEESVSWLCLTFSQFLPNDNGVSWAEMQKLMDKDNNPADGRKQLEQLLQELERLKVAIGNLNKSAWKALDGEMTDDAALQMLLNQKKVRVERAIERLRGYDKRGRPRHDEENIAATEAGREYEKLTGHRPTAPRDNYRDRDTIYGPFPEFVRSLLEAPGVRTDATRPYSLADDVATFIRKNGG